MGKSELAHAKAQVFKALGHPARLTIVEALAPGGKELCVCNLVELVPGSQATTSRHLDVLLRAGVVRRRRDGVRMMYSIAMPCILRFMPCIVRALRKSATAQAAAVGA